MGHHHGGEQLLDVEDVAIGRPHRVHVIRPRVDQLAEYLDVLAKAQVGVQVGALDQVIVRPAFPAPNAAALLISNRSRRPAPRDRYDLRERDLEDSAAWQACSLPGRAAGRTHRVHRIGADARYRQGSARQRKKRASRLRMAASPCRSMISATDGKSQSTAAMPPSARICANTRRMAPTAARMAWLP